MVFENMTFYSWILTKHNKINIVADGHKSGITS